MPAHYNHPADFLLEAVERAGSPVCVGLDPVWERLPDAVRRAVSTPPPALERFCVEVIDAVHNIAACIKFQAACFERYGAAGWSALEAAIAHARQRNNQLCVILDAKRGDIGISVEHYAAMAKNIGTHWITANPYLGVDCLQPFLGAGLGVFALVRTSNPGSAAIQSQKLDAGNTVAQHIAAQVAARGAGHLGSCGYSALGAVVGATHPEDAAEFRSIMGQQIFLVPGYGAQGAGADDVRACFNDKDASATGSASGAIITASRSVIYAFDDTDAKDDWQSAVANAATRFAHEIRNILPAPDSPRAHA
ncbi:MAG: orotidine-5'-phosphate decarboxylase [Phycisphaerales bacterium]